MKQVIDGFLVGQRNKEQPTGPHAGEVLQSLNCLLQAAEQSKPGCYLREPFAPLSMPPALD